MSRKQPNTDERTRADLKTEEKKRLAEALRANLKRRKLAGAERTETDAVGGGAAGTK